MAYRIGVLGGMGPLATQYFLDLFFDHFVRDMNPLKDQDYPDMTILMESSTPDRTDAIRNNNPAAADKINRDLRRLVRKGCAAIVVPCVTGHALIDPRWFDSGVIDIRAAVMEEFDRHEGEKVAVLATDGSIMSRVFKPLEKHFQLMYPDDDLQKDVMKVIYDSKGNNPDPTDCLNRIENIKYRMRQKGASLCLAGCTEIEMFVGRQNATDSMILPMDCLCTVLLEHYRIKKLIVKSVEN